MHLTPVKPDQATVDHTASPDGSVVDSPGAKVALDFLAPAQQPDELGRLGHYRILKVLGKGGMGMVFLAEDTKLERQVALKVMLPKFAEDAAAKQRFLREARTAAKIEHDHIVHIYQVDEDHGVPFLAMQLLSGSSLEDVLKRAGRLKTPQILRLGAQIAEGLAVAHAKGLIHRDIKPANIWIEANYGGRVKLLDFGLARTVQTDVGITQSGVLLGTPAYMPPEQARGDKVDHRCDLYSLGCVLYRMATGELPIKGKDTMALLMALALSEPTPPKEINDSIPPALNDLILKLLAKDAANRPETATAVAQALKKLEQEAARASRPGDVSGELAALAQPSTAASVASAEKPSSPFAQLSDSLEHGTPTVSESGRTHVNRAASTETAPARRPRRYALFTGAVGASALIVLAVVLITRPPDSKDAAELPGEFGLYFGSLGDRVEFTNLPHATPETLTMEAWLKVTGKGNGFIGLGGSTGYVLWRDNQYFGFTVYQATGAVLIRHPIPHSDRFIHLAGAWDGKEPMLFIDGRRVGKTEPFKGKATDEVFGLMTMGCNNAAPSQLEAVLGSVRISKGARYDKDFTRRRRLQREEDTFALYRFDEGRGNQLTDTSGNGYHGKIVGATWVKSDWTPPPRTLPSLPESAVRSKHALRFAGKDRVNLPRSLINKELAALPEFTIEAVITPEADRPEGLVELFGSSFQCGIYFLPDTGWHFSAQGQGVAGSGPWKKSQRMHLAAVHTPTELRFYVNGQLNGRSNLTAETLPKGNGVLWLGGSETQYFQGLIEVFRISKSSRYDKDFSLPDRFQPDADTLLLYHFDEGKGDKLIDSSGNGHHGKIVGAKWVKLDSDAATNANEGNPDRRILEWVVRPREDKVTAIIAADGRERPVHSNNAIPNTPFQVTSVLSRNNPAMSDEDLRLFQGHAKLRSLTFWQGAFTDEGLKYLVDCPNLLSLRLPSSKITDAGVAHLKKMRRMSSLHLYDVGVSDAGLRELSGLKNLQELQVYGPLVTVKGLTDLQRALPNCEMIPFHPKSTIKRSDRLIALNMQLRGGSATIIDDVGKRQVIDCTLDLPATPFRVLAIRWANTSLTGVWYQDKTRSILDGLRGAAALEAIELDNNTEIRDKDLDVLATLPNLRRLSLAGTEIDDGAIRHITAASSLTFVDVRRTKVSKDAVQRLSKAIPKCEIECDHGKIVGAKWVKNGTGSTPTALPRTPFDSLDPAQIAPAERYKDQPKELVAVFVDPEGSKPSSRGLSISADGKRLASSGGFEGVHVWDVLSQKPRLLKAEGVINQDNAGVAFTPDGLLAVATPPRVRLLDLAGPEPVERSSLALETGSPQAIAVARDGALLAVGGGNYKQIGELRVADLTSGILRERWSTKVYSSSVGGVEFSPCGKYLAGYAIYGGGCIVWDTKDGAELKRFGVWARHAFDPTGTWLYLGDNREIKRVRVGTWADDGIPIPAPEERRTAFSPPGDLIAIAMRNDGCLLLDAASGKERTRFKLPAQLVNAAFSPDGRHLALSCVNRRVYVMRLASMSVKVGEILDDDRRFAEWVFSKGGTITLDQEILLAPPKITSAEELPSSPFRVYHVRFAESTSFQDRDFDSLLQARHLKAVSILSQPITDVGLQQKLLSHPNVKNFELLLVHGCKNITDTGVLTVLAQTPDLVHLSVGNTSVSDQLLKSLPSLPKLRNIMAPRTKVSTDGLAALRGRALHVLRLDGCPGINDAGLNHLRDIKTLQWLRIERTNTTMDAIKKLAEALPECKIESDHGTFGPK